MEMFKGFTEKHPNALVNRNKKAIVKTIKRCFDYSIVFF